MINHRLVKLCTLASLVTALTLITVKAYASYVTGSVAILSSLMDSTMDMIVSAINFIALRYSLKPADDDHRFGHGKAQDLATMSQAIFITILSILIGIEAIKKFTHPTDIAVGDIGLIVMGISLFFTICLVAFQDWTYRKTGNNLVRADATHYLTDILTNIAVLISVYAATHLGLPIVDPILGLLVAIYIFTSAIKVGKAAFDNLMDKEFEEPVRQRILEVAQSHHKVMKIKNLRTRQGGHTSFIYFDFTMDGSCSLNEAHDIAHEIEDMLKKEFPESEIFIHQEPEV